MFRAVVAATAACVIAVGPNAGATPAVASGDGALSEEGIAGASAPAEDYVVRTGYVIPSDRTLDPAKVVDLQDYLTRIQWWYGENMARHGFDHRTFALETETDGFTPKINIVYDEHDSAYFLAEDLGYDRAAQWERLLEAMADSGFPGIAGQEGETWILIGEMHVQLPDGSKIAGPFNGGSGGRDHGGQAFLGGGLLFRVTEPFLADLRDYDGLTFERFGQYPLVYPTSFPGEGVTVSDIATAAQGGIAHELAHAFGDLPHQPRNRRNLMGGGVIRGAFLPQLFPTEDANLAYGSALALRHNRFFNATRTYDDNTDPSLTIDTLPGSVEPVEGHLEITFSASDASGIVAAFLWRLPIDEWEALELPGSTSGTWSIRTPYYEPGVATTYAVLVMDAQGNTARREIELTVDPGFNRAPTPLVRLAEDAMGNSLIRAGSAVTLAAAEDWEFRNNADWPTTTVEWDPDGDGSYDTQPSTAKVRSWTYPEPGIYRVIARFTDPNGAVTVSSPIGIRVYKGAASDTTDPEITITRPGNGVSYALNAIVTAKFECTDADTAIVKCAATAGGVAVGNGDAIPTGTTGTFQFVVTAEDLAGNQRVAIHSYSVNTTAPPLTPDPGSLPPCPTAVTPFTDVPATSFAFDDIACIYGLKITTGTSPTTYSPLDAVTRQQMASFLARLYRSITGTDAPLVEVPFTDMDTASFSHRDDIARIYGLGITTGTSPTSYSPLDNVTRQQMASFLARLHAATTGEGAPVVAVPFDDLSAGSATHWDDIARIYGLDITTGTSPTTYSPLDDVTRQQMASFLARLYRAA